MSDDDSKTKTFLNKEEDYAIVWTDDGLIDVTEEQEWRIIQAEGDRMAADYADYETVGDCD